GLRRGVGMGLAARAVDQDHGVLGGAEGPVDPAAARVRIVSRWRLLRLAAVHPTPRQRAWGRAPDCPRASYTPVDSTRPRWRRAQPTSRRRRDSSTPLAWFFSRSAWSRSAPMVPGRAASARRSAASLSA